MTSQWRVDLLEDGGPGRALPDVQTQDRRRFLKKLASATVGFFAIESATYAAGGPGVVAAGAEAVAVVGGTQPTHSSAPG